MRAFYRIVGIILILAAIGGLIFSLFSLAGIWSLKPRALERAQLNLDTINQTLTATAQGLDLTEQSLDATSGAVVALQATIEGSANTIEATIPMIGALGDLTGGDLPDAIYSAQTSLESAQESAQIIDSVMSALASVPLIRLDYDPPVPLHEALGELSASMNNVPESLATMETSLSEAGDSLEVMQSDIESIAANLEGIITSLQDSREVVEQYQDIVAQTQSQIQNLEQVLPTYANWIAWALTLILVWIVVLQVGMLVQGIDLVSRRVE